MTVQRFPQILIAVLSTATTAGAAAPAPSLDRLVSANGFGATVLRADHASGVVVADFRDHLYQQLDADSDPGRDLLYDAYFGVALVAEDGSATAGTWLTAATTIGLRTGTGVIDVQRSSGNLRFTETLFAPISLPHPAYVQLLTVRNDGDDTVQPRLFSLHNHHLGDDRHGVDVGDEDIWVQDQELVEVGGTTGLGIVVHGLGTPDSYSCDRVWERMPEEGALDGRCGSADAPWRNDDQVGGWQWTVGELAPGEEATIGVVVAFFDEGDVASASDPVTTWLAGRPAGQLIADEEAAWSTWQDTVATPDDATDDELAVYRQAVAYLRMGQVQEAGPAAGQIPASLPVAAGSDSFSHLWNITWVRDSAYAITALTAAGLTDEAGAALAFLLQGDAGTYAHLVGQDYRLSVCRLYGNGSEWSDWDDNGPNVELDNFGLLLWALGDWYAETGDVAFITDHSAVIFDGIADVLVDVVGDDGLVMADSSIWERHWNGHQQRFSYTQLWAVRGLTEAALLADAIGDTDRADTYRTSAAALRAAICTHLIDDEGVLAASAEQLSSGSAYLDLSGVDAFNNGTLDAAGPQGLASLAAWDMGLEVASGGGYARNDDGDLYDQQEWIWADLRLAQARRRGCDEAGARALEDRVTHQAMANHGVIPELLDPDAATYAGPAPMMGFGSGLYVLNLMGRAEATADCDDGIAWTCEDVAGGTDSGTADGGSADGGTADGGTGDGGASDGGVGDGGGDTDEGCGCGGGGGATLGLLLLPLLTTLRRRR